MTLFQPSGLLKGAKPPTNFHLKVSGRFLVFNSTIVLQFHHMQIVLSSYKKMFIPCIIVVHAVCFAVICIQDM